MKKTHIPILILVLIPIILFGITATNFSSDDGIPLRNSKYLAEYGPDKLLNEFQPIILTYIGTILGEISPEMPLTILNIISSIFIILISLTFLKNNLEKSIFLILIFFSTIFFKLNWFLAPYPLGFFFILLSLKFLISSIKENSMKKFIFSALILGVSINIYGNLILYLFFPVVYLYIKNKKSIKELILKISKYYLIAGIFILPWIIWHIAKAGLANFYYYPYNWYIVKYLPHVNKFFWGYEKSLNFEYISTFYNVFTTEVLTGLILIFVFLGLFTKQKGNKRAIFFTISIIPLLGSFAILVSPFGRYLYFLIIPSLLIASSAIYQIIIIRRKFAFILIAILIIMASLNFVDTYYSFKKENREGPQILDFLNFKEQIIQKECNIFLRHQAPQIYYEENIFLNIADLEEEDAISFLTTSRQEEFNEITKKYNICYIVQYNDKEKWIENYYDWVREILNKEITFADQPNSNDKITILKRGEIYTLYEIENES